MVPLQAGARLGSSATEGGEAAAAAAAVAAAARRRQRRGSNDDADSDDDEESSSVASAAAAAAAGGGSQAPAPAAARSGLRQASSAVAGAAVGAVNAVAVPVASLFKRASQADGELVSAALEASAAAGGAPTLSLSLRLERVTCLEAAAAVGLTPAAAQTCVAMLSEPGGLYLDVKSAYSTPRDLQVRWAAAPHAPGRSWARAWLWARCVTAAAPACTAGREAGLVFQPLLTAGGPAPLTQPRPPTTKCLWAGTEGRAGANQMACWVVCFKTSFHFPNPGHVSRVFY